MMSLVVLLATIELGWIIIKDIITPPIFLLEINELFEIFGLFMLVLIGIELLETIANTYTNQNTNHAKIVMAVALIAIARKVIILDVENYSGQALAGIAAISGITKHLQKISRHMTLRKNSSSFSNSEDQTFITLKVLRGKEKQ